MENYEKHKNECFGFVVDNGAKFEKSPNFPEPFASNNFKLTTANFIPVSVVIVMDT
jgi:hypothetical protein